MGMFRKKPVVIEAVRYGPYSPPSVEVAAFLSDCPEWGISEDGIIIKTLEGEMTAAIGDWIIKGVKGEFYPCRDDIFQMTYEPADAALSKASQPIEEK